MQSVEIPLYQTGKLSAAAFQIGAPQDQQTKSAEAVHWTAALLLHFSSADLEAH
eukprot:COSAG02_NODE_68831_length_218_cov_11.151261_1_plen_53_part_01